MRGLDDEGLRGRAASLTFRHVGTARYVEEDRVVGDAARQLGQVATVRGRAVLAEESKEGGTGSGRADLQTHAKSGFSGMTAT